MERVARVEPVDLGDSDRREQSCHREQVRVRLRHREACDDVRDDVEREKEERVRERSGRDDVLPRDVDACEPERREDPDDDEVDELTVAVAEREHHWLWPSNQITSSSSPPTTSSPIRTRAAWTLSRCLGSASWPSPDSAITCA